MGYRNSKINDVNYLLEFLEKTDEELAKETDVYKFIKDFKLEGNDKFFPNSVIYYYYIKQGKYHKYGRIHFFKLLGYFLKKGKTPEERGHYMSSNFKPTKEDYLEGRKLTRKYSYGKKNKKK